MNSGSCNAVLFHVGYNPVRFGPNYPAQSALLSFPDFQPGDEVPDPDDVVPLLQEECPPCRQDQLARILHYQHLKVDTVIQELSDWLYPEPNPNNDED